MATNLISMPDQTLSQRLPAFAAYMDSSSRLSPITKNRYLYEMQGFVQATGDPTLEELTPTALLEWNTALAKRRLAYNTGAVKHAALGKFLDFLDRFEESPQTARLLRALERLEVPGTRKPRRETRALTEVEVLRMLAHAFTHPITGVRDLTIIQFLYDTGVRRAELAELLLADLDMERRRAKVVGKGDKERLVLFSEECRQQLEWWLEDQGLHYPQLEGVDNVFITLRGTPMQPNEVTGLVRRVATEAGLKGLVWAHLFRHNRITALANSGMNVLDVAKLAGHADVNTTAKYFHQDLEQVQEAYDRATKREDVT